MTTTDLSSPDLNWMEHNVEGTDKPLRMAMLHASAEGTRRTLLVEFPPAATRDAVGHEPDGEELVVLSGSLSMSGATAAAGSYLLVEPRATRTATSVEDGTRVLAWFSGPGGGWIDGEDPDAGAISSAPLVAGEIRGPSDRMPGSVSVHQDLSEQTFPTDVDVLWLDHGRWAHVPSGDPVPGLTGTAVVRHWL